MSQIIRATFSPVVPGQGNTRNVERSGRRYMSDSSMRTKPSIDDPSNMILPSSASSNCRSGISTFLIVPRMSVNCSRRNFTFSRSVRSRIWALVSFEVVLDIQGRILAVARLEYGNYASLRVCRRPSLLNLRGGSSRQYSRELGGED